MGRLYGQEYPYTACNSGNSGLATSRNSDREGARVRHLRLEEVGRWQGG